MRHVAILLTASMLLTGCEQELSKDKIDLLEAVMFAFNGIENNTQEKFRFQPWKRTIGGQTIEYVTFGNNSYGFSDANLNAKTKDSSFVRYTRKISSPETCVFYMQSVEEFSKGNSKEDFSAFAGGHEDDILHLMNAYRFEMIYDLEFHTSNVYLEGPAVVCDLKGSCQNAYMQTGSPEDDRSSDEKPAKFARREKAVDLIKKACPGKPY
jgi:hypothetical protein